MKVLVIGRDPKLFIDNSESRQRAQEYAKLFVEYHVLSVGTPGKMFSVGANFYLWPTHPLPLILSWIDAIFTGQKIIKKHSIELIDAQDPGESGVTAFILSKLTGTPFRIQIHTDVFSPYFRNSSWKEWLRYRLAKFLIPRAGCLRVVSERLKKSILEAVNWKRGARISMLPIFTDVSKFLSRNPDSQDRFKDYNFKMIAVGRFIDREKNFSMLIEMMREFIKVNSKALLVFVGEGSDRKNYESIIRNYGLENNVILEGWRDDLSAFYKTFDLYLSSSNYEGWGRTVIEAMASGLPVIMTDVGLAGEVVKSAENGVVVPVADKEKFSQAVRDLYENPEKRIRLAQRGKETVKNLKPATKEEYLALYKKSFSTCVPLETHSPF